MYSFEVIFIFLLQQPGTVLVPESADLGHEQADDVCGQSSAQREEAKRPGLARAKISRTQSVSLKPPIQSLGRHL